MMDAMATVVSSLADIDWPFLILHSEIDELTSVEGSKLMYEKAKSKDKYLKVSYSKTCLKRPLKNRQNKGLKDKW